MSHFSADNAAELRVTKRRRARILAALVSVLVVSSVVVGGLFATGIMGRDEYVGAGTGEVQFLISAGDYGDDIAINLAAQEVIKSSKTFYSMLLETKPEPVFVPGLYKLKKHMSNFAALEALLNPSNRIENTAVIPEGTTLKGVLSILSQSLNIPLEELQAAVANPSSYPGVPSQATTLEGFLFPATYKFSPGVKAVTVISTMVANTIAAMDRAGIPKEDRWKRIILASIIEKEMPSIPGDAAKISRVFYNRVDAGMNLGSDATTCYGVGLVGRDCILITQAALDDASNKYNTRKNPGLPIGPICNPGYVAIDAAQHPADGPWLFFVTVNLKTGETIYTTSNAEHEIAAEKYRKWIAENPNAF